MCWIIFHHWFWDTPHNWTITLLYQAYLIMYSLQKQINDQIQRKVDEPFLFYEQRKHMIFKTVSCHAVK